jgi:hypothetical protein
MQGMLKVMHDLARFMHDLPCFMQDLLGVMHDMPGVMHDMPGVMHDLPGVMHDMPGVMHEMLRVMHDLLRFMHDLLHFMHEMEQGIRYPDAAANPHPRWRGERRDFNMGRSIRHRDQLGRGEILGALVAIVKPSHRTAEEIAVTPIGGVVISVIMT